MTVFIIWVQSLKKLNALLENTDFEFGKDEFYD